MSHIGLKQEVVLHLVWFVNVNCHFSVCMIYSRISMSRKCQQRKGHAIYIGTFFVCFKGRIAPLPDKLNPYLQMFPDCFMPTYSMPPILYYSPVHKCWPKT